MKIIICAKEPYSACSLTFCRASPLDVLRFSVFLQCQAPYQKPQMAGFLGVGSCSIDVAGSAWRRIARIPCIIVLQIHRLAACENCQKHSGRPHPCRATKMARMMHHDHNYNATQDDQNVDNLELTALSHFPPVCHAIPMVTVERMISWARACTKPMPIAGCNCKSQLMWFMAQRRVGSVSGLNYL